MLCADICVVDNVVYMGTVSNNTKTCLVCFLILLYTTLKIRKNDVLDWPVKRKGMETKTVSV